MKKWQLIMIFVSLQGLVLTHAYGESENKQSDLNLVKQKCTNCHDISRVQDMHKAGKDPMTVVKEMQKKENSDISDEQAADIARYLKAPFWQQPLIQNKCTKCHPLNFIFNRCAVDPFSDGIPKEKIKLMQEKGADITDKQVDELYNTIRW